MLAVFEKEFKSYFRSAVGPIFIGLFLLVSTGIFVFGYLFKGIIAYPQYLNSLTLVFMITIPILTMKTFSEERRTKTDQLLLTAPVKASDIVMGKYFAAVAVLLITILLHSLDAIVIAFFANNMYFLDVAMAYIGLFLVGCAYIAIGVFVSSTTENQVISAIITFAILLVIYVIQWLTTSVVSSVSTGIITCGIIALAIVLLIYFTTKNKTASVCVAIFCALAIAIVALVDSSVFAGLLNTFLRWVSLLQRFQEFLSGSVGLSSLVYLLSLSFVFNYMTVYQIEKRRWVG